MERIDILGIPIDNITMSEALTKAEEMIRNQTPNYMAFLNISQIVFCKENDCLLRYYEKAGMVIVDGTNATRLMKVLRTPLVERIYGNDFIYEVCRIASDNSFSVFFWGGSSGGAEQAIKNIKQKCPNLKVAGFYAPPYGFETNAGEMHKINSMLQNSNADILFVGLGSPKQDIFIEENKDVYQIPLSIPIGSGIDITGDIYRRAPRWISNIGLEWLYRCFQEPTRLFKRYIHVLFKIGKYYRQYKKELRNRGKAQ